MTEHLLFLYHTVLLERQLGQHQTSTMVLTAVRHHLDMVLLFEPLLKVSRLDDLGERKPLTPSSDSAIELFLQLYMIILMTLVCLLLLSLLSFPLLSSLYALLNPL